MRLFGGGANSLLNNFNPRTPYGMRLLVYGDVIFEYVFQSTHPLRDATVRDVDGIVGDLISIHAPLTGCDI